MDGVDGVLADFSVHPPRLIASRFLALPDLRRELLALALPGHNELDRLAQLDSIVARRFAQVVNSLLETACISAQEVRAIGSHGQTVRHAPTASEAYTVQIGNPSLIAELTGITTVADFRRRDMAAGGQGAPLAPAFHDAFFRHSRHSVAVVNIGGIANLTLLPAAGDQPVIGFDTGPGNLLLDAWAQRHLGQPMDSEGAWGSRGRVVEGLLDSCLADDFFRNPPPKSTGREHFNLGWLEERLNAWSGSARPEDVQATLSELTVVGIADALRSHAAEATELLVCGGGVHNPLLMDKLKQRLGNIKVTSTAERGVDPDTLEALGFAWLAKRTLDGLPGNLPSVTGARGERVLGGIYPP